MAVSETKIIPEYKRKKVEEIKEILETYSVIGLAHISQIESNMLQNIRKNLRGQIGIKIIKNNLFKIALDEIKKENYSALKDSIEGATALIYSNINIFKLKLLIEKNRNFTFVKSGSLSPSDILIARGDTGFPPGPIITELNEAGLRTRIKGGTIWVQEDTIVVKEGEEISPILSIVLTRMDIRPVELGLELYSAYDGEIYGKDDLSIDFESISNNLSLAVNQGFNLAVHIGYSTPETIEFIIQKAYSQAKSLILKGEIIVKEFINEILAMANSKATVIAKEIIDKNPNALSKELVESLNNTKYNDEKSKEVKSKDSEDNKSSNTITDLFNESEIKKNKDEDEDTSVSIGNMFE